MQTDFFFSANSNSGNNYNNKDVSEIVDKCNLDFFPPMIIGKPLFQHFPN